MGRIAKINTQIVSWYPPNKHPKEGKPVVAVIRYRIGTYTAPPQFDCLIYWEDIGYVLQDDDEVDDLEVIAWCDLELYGG